MEEEGIALLSFTVERNYAGWRLDEYLKQKIRRATMERVREAMKIAYRPMASVGRPGSRSA